MIRIGHVADVHLTSGPRFEDTMRVLEWIAQDGREQRVELWLVAGDLTGTTVPHVATIEERNGMAHWLRLLAERAPTIVVAGNHDRTANDDLSSDLTIYGRLKAQNAITVVTRPQILEAPGARVYCLPFPSKRWAVGSGAVAGTLDQQKVGMEGGLRAILDAWRLDAVAHAGEQRVGCFHVNVANSRMGGGEVLNVGVEVELSRHDLEELGLDAGCLGHLHLAQEVADGWWYAGTPARQNFGEQSYACSYNVVDVEAGRRPRFTQRLTPARRLVTVRMEWAQRNGEWALDGESIAIPDVADADLRIIVTIPEEAADACPLEQVEANLLEAGAHTVRIERRFLPTTRVRSEAITRAVTLEEQLGAYFESLADPPDEAQRARVLAKLAELHAEPVAQEVAA